MTYPTIMPALTLDFQNSQQLDPRVTFSRSSSATYINSAGLVVSAADHEPRFDHDPVTGECLGLLVEESRTNFVYPSIVPSSNSGAWRIDGAAVTTNAGTAPDGTNTASLVEEASGTGANRAYFFTGGIVRDEVYSFFLKASSPDAVFSFTFTGQYAPIGTVEYTFSTGTISGSFPNDVSVEPYPNGWVRLSTTSFQGTTLSTSSYVRIQDFTGDFFIWGVQREVGTFPTSYIPTAGSTVIRDADVAQITTADIYGDEFTIINKPFGVSSGSDTLHIKGQPYVERSVVYNENLSQEQINTVTNKEDDEFWRWRILGSSFALPTFVTDGQVTVDWGDGTVEVLTTGEHTFTNGSSYHEVGFRLDSGTYFRPNINNNGNQRSKLEAIGPAPESMKFSGERAFFGCDNLEIFDATVDANGQTFSRFTFLNCFNLKAMPLVNTTGVIDLQASWEYCSGLTSFPFIDTASVTNFNDAWNNCSGLTSFPNINTSNGLYFGSPSGGSGTWKDCTGLTSFPLLDFSSALRLNGAWRGCTGLTSFPNIDTSSVILFGGSNQGAWQECSNLTSFPLINTSSATDLTKTWRGCSSLTSFPSIDTSNCQFFTDTWNNCSSLTAFPALDFSSATGSLGNDSGGSGTWRNCSGLTSFPFIDISGINGNISGAWRGCTGLTSFPLLNFSNVTIFGASNQGCWQDCTGLTSFPAINTSSGTRFTKAWSGCSGLTSFPLLDFSNATSIENAWNNCSGLTSFPLINTSNVTTRLGSPTGNTGTWRNCSGLTSFPALDLSNCTDVTGAWAGCTGLTSFPALDLSSCTTFGVQNQGAWQACISLTTFPACTFSSAATTFLKAWYNANTLVNFPANMFDNCSNLVSNAFYLAFTYCDLSIQSIENILVSLDASGSTGVTLDINLGLNAGASSWTAAATTAYNSLVTKGWLISNNP